ncbi:RNA-binding protein 4B-like isoform X3 [Phalacrocorax carbo]|uniref:RNA-binding protein 4B-like isoform X3 n=1 Tax=Phalacrocorax carbo TaxID=9209 RepID=UPI00311920A4
MKSREAEGEPGSAAAILSGTARRTGRRLGEMVKLFIGNLPREATEQEIRSLFEQYGKVLECDIIKNYGFVHIEDKTAAEDAIRNLHHHKLHGVCINVEASKNKSKASTKLHVGNISPACTNLELRAKFEEYGPVIECDIVKDYAFVHMERAEDAVEAIRGLDNTEFQARPPRRRGSRRRSPNSCAEGRRGRSCPGPEQRVPPARREARPPPALVALPCLASGCACSCPPAGCGRRPGWETRAAATAAGRKGTGLRSAR